MTDKARKKIHAELNKYRDEDIDVLADLDIEDRTSPYEDEEPNRYQKILAKRREAKWIREQKKQEKLHIGKRKHIRKRAVVEAERQQG